ncbi:hypothetical protein G3I59_14060 [Amycolatopsis rubida]|uniref:Solute-binding protein family 5 domain-containing protein n=1 Tax=Amycolatopsis rubida TaxID=112413 RepID=A0ABX0BV66_9PSEU|nr:MULTISPECIES: ABC transporter substrate-binding protein [Amycolatopsis]MYW91696.1 hypothetical protein [Amycolatopsis rubida]NEC56680.1 hypothetical protein [Amycolatopsis rubida]OAP20429.1 Nickel-binding periplasmic protein precursor [Amycolatopsis sp. M39]
MPRLSKFPYCPAKIVAISAVTVLITASCAAKTSQASDESGTLTVGFSAAPPSLDPAKTTGNGQAFLFLAYDPLIYRDQDGALKPRLATSWNYVGTGNKVFELHLRAGVRFSDGSPLTADTAKANFDYLRKVGVGTAGKVAKDATVTVVDPLTIRLTLTAANPDLPTVLSQDTMPGLISGRALADPATLAKQTQGTGPFVLDPAATVPNDRYTYTANPQFWDKANVHYQKVVVRVIPNPNTALAAIKTGQVDVIGGNYTTVASAKAAGLNVAYAPFTFMGLVLADRAGTVVPALRDPRVRQALNYAVDRQKITRALFGEYGTPTEQIQLPGRDGSVQKTVYQHDPAKARQLLAEAGYANGFALPALTTSAASSNLVVQAIADDLKQVGVTLELTNDADTTKYQQDMRSKKWGAFGIAFGSLTTHQMAQVLLRPGGFYNPFDSDDPGLTARYAEAAAAPPDQRAQLDRQIISRVVDQGWFVTVTFSPLFYFSRAGVTNVRVSPGEPVANPVEWRPAGGR